MPNFGEEYKKEQIEFDEMIDAIKKYRLVGYIEDDLIKLFSLAYKDKLKSIKKI